MARGKLASTCGLLHASPNTRQANHYLYAMTRSAPLPAEVLQMVQAPMVSILLRAFRPSLIYLTNASRSGHRTCPSAFSALAGGRLSPVRPFSPAVDKRRAFLPETQPEDTQMLHSAQLLNDRDFQEEILRDLQFGRNLGVDNTPKVVAQLAGNNPLEVREAGRVVAGPSLICRL